MRSRSRANSPRGVRASKSRMRSACGSDGSPWGAVVHPIGTPPAAATSSCSDLSARARTWCPRSRRARMTERAGGTAPPPAHRANRNDRVVTCASYAGSGEQRGVLAISDGHPLGIGPEPNHCASGPRVTPSRTSILRQNQGVSSGIQRFLADRQAHRPITKIDDQIQTGPERLHVAGDDLKGSDVAMLDLRDTGNAHTHGACDILLAEPELLAGLGELMAARLREELSGTFLDDGRGDTGLVQFPLQIGPVPRRLLRHVHSSSSQV